MTPEEWKLRDLLFQALGFLTGVSCSIDNEEEKKRVLAYVEKLKGEAA